MEWTYWDASSTAANMNCIKSRFSIATLPWLDEKLKKKQFNNLKENKHGTKHHLTGIRYMDKSCKPSDRRQAEFLVYGRDASLPNYMWRKLNAQCSAMYIRQVHVWLLLIITLNFWTCTKAIAALPTCKTYLNGTYIFLTSTWRWRFSSQSGQLSKDAPLLRRITELLLMCAPRYLLWITTSPNITQSLSQYHWLLTIQCCFVYKLQSNASWVDPFCRPLLSKALCDALPKPLIVWLHSISITKYQVPGKNEGWLCLAATVWHSTPQCKVRPTIKGEHGYCKKWLRMKEEGHILGIVEGDVAR